MEFWGKDKKRVPYGDVFRSSKANPPPNAAQPDANTPAAQNTSNTVPVRLRQIVSSAVLAVIMASGGFWVQNAAGDVVWMRYLGIALYVLAAICGFLVVQGIAVFLIGGALFSVSRIFRLGVIRFGALAGLAAWGMTYAGYPDYTAIAIAGGAAIGILADVKKYL